MTNCKPTFFPPCTVLCRFNSVTRVILYEILLEITEPVVRMLDVFLFGKVRSIKFLFIYFYFKITEFKRDCWVGCLVFQFLKNI